MQLPSLMPTAIKLSSQRSVRPSGRSTRNSRNSTWSKPKRRLLGKGKIRNSVWRRRGPWWLATSKKLSYRERKILRRGALWRRSWTWWSLVSKKKSCCKHKRYLRRRSRMSKMTRSSKTGTRRRFRSTESGSRWRWGSRMRTCCTQLPKRIKASRATSRTWISWRKSPRRRSMWIMSRNCSTLIRISSASSSRQMDRGLRIS